jgi:uncharacterized protein (DUF486 family)
VYLEHDSEFYASIFYKQIVLTIVVVSLVSPENMFDFLVSNFLHRFAWFGHLCVISNSSNPLALIS